VLSLDVVGPAGFELGQQLNLEEVFNKGDLIDVRSRSIGKGFQGILFALGLNGQVRRF